MMRKCSRCHKDFTPQELSREESRGMEAERKALGLEGVLFRYYACSACGNADIFLDIHPLTGESEEDFRRRRDELEAIIRDVHPEGVGIILVERP
jgi:recombinational DNA repair protein (RecF pathway)